MAEPEPDPQAEHGAAEAGPAPSFWPFLLALGVAMTLIGVISKIEVVIAGLVVIVVSLGAWVRDARRDYRSLG